MSPNPTRAEVHAAVREIARAELRLEGELPPGDLADVLDSVQRLTLVVAIEDRFQICFDPDDEGEARTLDGVVTLVLRKVEAAHVEP